MKEKFRLGLPKSIEPSIENKTLIHQNKMKQKFYPTHSSMSRNKDGPKNDRKDSQLREKVIGEKMEKGCKTNRQTTVALSGGETEGGA